ncbi:DUF7507 domain-containing protein [Algoriphagus yeomjeoni]|uniref:DUF7507 domain-containing protein n=1 Tax=Algoriphagus yeomjeoni TaxID=291403 RepID=UPI003CE4732D
MTSFAQVITPTTPFVLTNQGCNQQNLRVTAIEFRAADPADLEGTPIGQLVVGEIWATWAVSGNGYNPHIQFNISIDGNAPTAIANCVSVKNNGVARNIIDGETFKIANFSWPYGSELSIDNLYIHWLTGNINSDTDACQTSAGNSQCSRPSATFLVRTPLVANFDFTANCDDFTVDFEDLSTGGNPAAYTYAWSFTGGNPASSGASDPQNVNFGSAGEYGVTLQVTSEGITKTLQKTVSLYEFLGASGIKVDDDCTVTNTGSIDLTPTGGLAPFTYAWSTNNGSGLVANAEDQSGLSAGTYSVIVTDDRGCTVTKEFTIAKEVCSMTITKTAVMVDEAGDGVLNAAEEIIDYEIVVTNTGNVTLTNVMVVDPLTGTDVNIGDLAPGASETVEASYAITQEDLNTNGGGDGDIDNTATAESDQTDLIEASEEVMLTQRATMTITKTAVMVDEAGDGVLNAAEEIIDYEIVVTNTGNVTLTNVMVVDPLTGTDVNIGDLAPGASETVEASYAITQEDLNTNGGGDGDIDNTATAESDQTDLIEASEEVMLTQRATMTITKTAVMVDEAGDGVLNAAEEIIDYEIVVTNTGNVTLTNVMVVDPLTGTDVNIGDLAPGASETVEASYAITQEDLNTNGGGDGDIDNTATAESDQTDLIEASEEVMLTQRATMTITKTAVMVDEAGDGVLNAAEEIIDYEIVVTNTGNVTLTNVMVVDPLTGTDVNIGDLAPGASETVEASYAITQEDLNTNGGGDGDIDNTATAESDQTDLIEASEEVMLTQRATMTITKTAVMVDEAGDGVLNAAEEIIDYEIVVTNTGNVTLTNVMVVDPLTGTDVNIGDLAPGASETVEASYAITQEDLNTNGGGDGDIDNTATAESDQTDLIEASEEVMLTQRATMTITKTAVMVDEAGDGVLNAAEEIIDYEIVVTNTGNVTLTNVMVVDPLTGTDVNIGDLAPGASETVEASYAITQEDLNTNGGGDGDIDNTATAESDQTDLIEASEEVMLTQRATMTITKTAVMVDEAGDGVLNAAEEIIDYEIVVTNTGNVTLTNVMVVDPLTGTDVNIGDLAPGASETVEASYAITQEDLNTNGGGDGDIDNTATAESDQTDLIEASEEVMLTQRATMTITKTAVMVDEAGDGVLNAAEEIIDYEIVVTNTGNVTLTNVMVVDPLTGTDVNIGDLAPGASETVEASYAITQEDLNTNGGGDGDIDNTATAESDQTDLIEASEEVMLTQRATMTITKTAVMVDEAGDGVLNAAEEIIDYEIVVTNTGNVTLTNVMVVDPLTGTDVNIGDLAPGASETVEASYAITQEDLNTNGGGDGDIDNTATAESDQTDLIEASEEVMLTQRATMTITKTAVMVDEAGDGVLNAAEEIIDYEIVVTNTGNVTLTNVMVVDPLTGTDVNIGDLAPGASETVEASYAITQEDLNTNGGGDGDIDNTATAESDQTDLIEASEEVMLTQRATMTITKTAVMVDEAGDGVLNAAEEIIDYEIVVTNTGNVTLTNVMVVDPLTGTDVNIGDLAPGASETVEASYAITQEDLNTNGGGDGDIDNTATAESDQTDLIEASEEVMLTQRATMTITKTAVMVDEAGDGVLNAAEEIIDYEIVVTNTGNVTLTNVMVVDPLTGTDVNIGDLAPGASETVEASYAITQEDLNTNGGGDGDIDNTATAESDQTDLIEASEEVMLTQRATMTITKTAVMVDEAGDGVLNAAEEIIDYEIVVTNTGNVTLTNVMVVDPLTGTDVNIGDLAPGASETVEASYAITQEDLNTNGGGDGDIDNTATAESDQTDLIEASEEVMLTQRATMTITKTAVMVDEAGDGVLNAAEEIIDYEIVVTNTGNVTLTNVMVVDPLTGTDVNIGDLAPGASETVEASYAITQEDLNTNGGGDGDIDNTATAESDQTDLIEASEEVMLTQRATMTITKTAVMVDEAGDGVLNAAEEIIDYEIVVTNTGNVTLTNVMVVDPLTGTDVNIGDLAPGASETVEASYAITQEDLNTNGGGDGDIDNTATAESDQTDLIEASEEVMLTQRATMTITKTAVMVDEAGDGVLNAAEEIIDYEIVVTNTGNVTLTNVMVVDPLTGTDVNIGDLAPGASETVEASYAITQEDLNTNGGGDGDIDNTATAESDQTDLIEASEEVMLTQRATMTITKTAVMVDEAGDGVLNAAEEIIDYEIVVTNTGNVTLTNVMVVDPLTGTDVNIGDLAPGASETVEASYAITQEDLNTNGGGDGDIDNTATAESDQTDLIEASEEVMLTQRATMTITKTAVMVDEAGDGVLNAAEEIIDYEIVVTNTGNVTLTNVMVVDPLTGTDVNIGDLAPGASETVEASYAITQEDLNTNGGGDGDIDNTATAESDQTDLIEASEEVMLTQRATMTITKTAVMVDEAGDGVLNAAEEIIDYEIVVTNTGNVTLTNVMVVDPLTGTDVNIGDLAPGASETVEASYAITQEDLNTNGGGDGDIDNTATAESDQTDLIEASEEVMLTQRATMTITKTAVMVDEAGDGVLNAAEEIIDYEIVVTNTGNVTLTNVMVVDPLTGTDVNIGDLAPGASETVEASYAITQEDLNTNGGGDGDIDNTATAESDQTDLIEASEEVMLTQRATMTITKTAVMVDEAGDGVLNAAEEIIDYEIVVTNTGNVTLTNVMVVDPLTGTDVNIGDLAPGASETVEASYAITQEDLNTNGGGDGDIDNTATAESDQTDLIEASEEVMLTQRATMTITKTAVMVDEAGDGVLNAAEEIIDYEIVVTNTGNVTLTNVMVVDPLTGTDVNIGDLAPGASETVEASYAITQEDLNTNGGGDGDIDNTATAESDQTDLIEASEEVMLTQRATMTITKTAVMVDEAGDGVLNAAEEIIDYEIVVTNTGNVTLTNVMVVDPLTGTDVNIGDLAPGASETVEASYAITQEDLNTNGGGDGDIDNTATAESDQTDLIEASEEVMLTQRATMTITKTAVMVDEAGDGVLNAAEEIIDYEIVVTNTGNVTLTNVMVVDPLTGTDVNIGDLAPGASETVEASYAITQEDLNTNGGGDGDIDNTATAESDQTDLIEASEEVMLTQRATMTITKTAVMVDEAGDGVLNAAEEIIDYEIVVTNTGNVTLTNVMVVDPLTGTDVNIGDLAPGASETVEASYAITQEDLNTNGGGDGDIDNTATAESDQTDLIEASEEVMLTQRATMTITKTAVMVDEAGDGVLNAAEEIIDYEIVVTNTGNVTLTNVMVVDPLTGTDVNIGDLAPGASETVEASYAITQEDLNTNGGGDGDIDNTATAESDQTDLIEASEEVMLTQRATMTITKTAVMVDEAGDGVLNAAEEIIDYEIVVTNTGNVTLTNVMVVDPLTGTDVNIGDLAPGASETVEASYAITQEDLNTNGGGDGDIDNTATAESDQTDLIEASEEVMLTQRATMTITKTAVMVDEAGDGVLNAAEEIIDYEIVVTNTGNVTLTNVMVVDPLTGTDVNIGDLAPGASETVEASYAITQEDLNTNGGGDGDIDNTATAESDQTDLIEASEEVMLTQRATMTITKTAVMVDEAGDGVLNAAEEIIDYEIVVTNTGNVTLTNVMVVDPLTGTDVNIGDLAPGASETVEASYAITQEDLNTNGGGDGDIDNTATAESDQTDLIEASEEVMLTQRATMTITKTAVMVDEAGDGVLNAAEEIIDYEIVVTNTGNVTLTNVMVVDPLTGTDVNIGDLAPGASETVEASYAITQEDLNTNGGGDGDIDNTATAESDQTDLIEASEEVMLTQNPSLDVTKTLVSNDDELNGILSFEIKVENTGNITLYDIYVEDETTGDNWTIAELAPEGVETFTVNVIITQEMIEGECYENTAFAEAREYNDEQSQPGSENPSAEYIVIARDADSATGCFTQTPSLSIEKTADQDSYDAVGDILTYEIVVTNTGNVTLENIVVTDPQATITGGSPIATLAPGASAAVTASYTVTQSDLDAGSFTNTATAAATFGETELSESDDATVDAIQTPSLSIEKTADQDSYDAVGDILTYEIVVTNIGNVTLENIVVTDPQATITGGSPIATLAPGASAVVTASYTVTQSDLDAGSFTNTATAAATFGETELSDSDDATVDAIQTPLLSIEKTADQDSYDAAGDILTYEIVVTNTGNVTLSDIVVTDPQATITGGSPIATLAPGASAMVTASYTVTQSDLDAGSFTNTATAAATFGETELSDSDDATVDAIQTPLLSIEKTADQSSYDAVGDILTYEIVVTNTGNVTLENIVVTDPQATITGGSPIATLAPGASAAVTASYTVTQSDLDAGSFTNTATAAATFGETELSESDDATVDAIQTPSLSIEKTADQDSYDAVGDILTYEIVVTNTGNVTLENIVVTDPQATITGGSPIATLAPGASAAVTASYTVTQSDLDAGSFTNTATAAATFGETELSESDDATVDAIQTPSLSIEKTADQDSYDAVGDILTYEIVVTNTGNVTLENIVVTDPQATITGGSPIATLAPEASAAVTASYTVTQSDLDAGSFTNTATAAATFGEIELSESDDATVDAIQTPSLSIEKTADQDSYDAVGDILTYEIVVTNTGNVTLENIVVTDPQATITGGSPIATLAPGASAVVTASYTVTQSDLDAGSFTNTATAAATFGETELSDSDDATVDAIQTSSIQIVKTDNGAEVDAAGDVITYTLTVTNTGNVTLTNVMVTDPLTGLDQNVGTLAPGASSAVNTDYVVTQGDVDAGSILNTALTTGDAPGDEDPSDEDQVETPVTQIPAIQIVKTADQTEVKEIGQVITYTLTITNTGNVTLTDVTITDPMTGFDKNIGTLLPGEGVEEQTTYTVTDADLQKESILNVAIVKGTTPNEETIEDEDSVSVGVSNNQIIANDDDFGTYFLSYGGRLGNILDNDLLNGVRPDDADVDFEFTELDGVIGLLIDENGELSLIPGVNEAREYTLKYTLREVANPSNSDDALVVFRLQNDEVDLSVTKTSFEAEIFEGDEFEYEIVISNGDTPATNVVVTDNLPNGVSYISNTVTSNTTNATVNGNVSGSAITWTIPAMEAGATITIRVRVKAVTPGTITNTVIVGSDEDDTDETNNQDDDVNVIKPFHIPNVITPNGDGDNDTFEIEGINIFVSTEITIFNRYGDHVLEQENYRNDWNAPGQTAGTYFYVLTGVDSSGQRHEFKGWIQVIKD